MEIDLVKLENAKKAKSATGGRNAAVVNNATLREEHRDSLT
jgi:hypothetical protein